MNHYYPSLILIQIYARYHYENHCTLRLAQQGVPSNTQPINQTTMTTQYHSANSTKEFEAFQAVRFLKEHSALANTHLNNLAFFR